MTTTTALLTEAQVNQLRERIVEQLTVNNRTHGGKATPDQIERAADRFLVSELGQAEAIANGKAFRRVAGGHLSVIGYRPPITAREYADLIAGIADMAKLGDKHAAIASRLVHVVNLYGTAEQIIAKLYDTADEVLSGKFDDVLGRSGPEGGRHSAHQHDHSFRDRLLVWEYLSAATRKAFGQSRGTAGSSGLAHVLRCTVR